MQIKIVRKRLQPSNYSTDVDILWYKDKEDKEWSMGDIQPSGEGMFWSEWIAKFLNGWSSKFHNEVEEDVDSYECEMCGWQDTTTITVRFENPKLQTIEEYYDTHFGSATSEEEVIEQWAKNGIELEIVRDDGDNAYFTQEFVQENYVKAREEDDGCNIKDDYHTMSELYFNRMVMFDIITKVFSDNAWKSKLHDDGTMFDGYFVVGIDTPHGQFTYHYDMKYWDMFTCKEVERAPKYDGHLPKDIDRLYSLL